MKPWMLALFGAVTRVQAPPVTLTEDGTWTAPTTTSRVDLSGYGGPGTPGTTLEAGYQVITTTYIEYEDGTTEQFGPTPGEIVRGASAPGGYCNPPEPFGTATRTDCYNFADVPEETTPPTRGPSTTGFGKTFLGGLGGPATTPTSFPSVAVTPGATYTIKVPSGGSLTITYWQ